MAGGTYKLGNVWWAYWTEPVKDPKTGKVRQKKRYASSGSPKRSEAVTLLSTKIHEARTRKPVLDLPDPTYEQIRDLWTASFKPGAYKRKDGAIYFDGRTHLDAVFSGWKAKDIDVEDIRKLQEVLRAKGINPDHTVTSLRTMLNYAVRRKRLQVHQLPEEFPMLRLGRETPPVPIDDDFLEPVCKELPEPFRSGFTLSYHTGMRLSEVERLTWSQVFLDKRYLYFPSAKTREDRRVPLLGGTDELLAKLPRNGELVFPGFDDRTARARAWRDAAAKVGLGEWRCRKCNATLEKMKCPEHGELTERTAKYRGPLMRFTRTTAIRNLTNRGVPIQRIMQMTGHKNVPTHMGYNVADEKDLELIREKYDAQHRRKVVTLPRKQE